jgi:nucleoid DNA-binding protein
MAKAIRNEMNQQEVIRAVSEGTGFPQTEVRAILDEYKELVQRHVQKGSTGSFKILGLVKLDKTKRKARKGRNPFTGEEIKVPAKNVVRAKPLSGLKNLEL